MAETRPFKLRSRKFKLPTTHLNALNLGLPASLQDCRLFIKMLLQSSCCEHEACLESIADLAKLHLNW